MCFQSALWPGKMFNDFPILDLQIEGFHVKLRPETYLAYRTSIAKCDLRIQQLDRDGIAVLGLPFFDQVETSFLITNDEQFLSFKESDVEIEKVNTNHWVLLAAWAVIIFCSTYFLKSQFYR